RERSADARAGERRGDPGAGHRSSHPGSKRSWWGRQHHLHTRARGRAAVVSQDVRRRESEMAKLYLTFEGRPLKEFTLSHGVCTMCRLPYHLVQVDTLAVSGHHAKVYWAFERYVVEDNGSTNGTYVNDQ